MEGIESNSSTKEGLNSVRFLYVFYEYAFNSRPAKKR